MKSLVRFISFTFLVSVILLFVALASGITKLWGADVVSILVLIGLGFFVLSMIAALIVTTREGLTGKKPSPKIQTFIDILFAFLPFP